MKILGKLLLLLLVANGCGDDGATGAPCGSDNDCKGDRICINGICSGPGSSNDSLCGITDELEAECKQMILCCPQVPDVCHGGATTDLEKEVSDCMALRMTDWSKEYRNSAGQCVCITEFGAYHRCKMTTWTCRDAVEYGSLSEYDPCYPEELDQHNCVMASSAATGH